MNSTEKGYHCGGSTPSGNLSIIDTISFPFDSGTASSIGNINDTRAFKSIDQTDFVSLFV